MKCNYPGAYKRNKMTTQERKELNAKVLAHVAARGLLFPLLSGLRRYT